MRHLLLSALCLTIGLVVFAESTSLYKKEYTKPEKKEVYQAPEEEPYEQPEEASYETTKNPYK